MAGKINQMKRLAEDEVEAVIASLPEPLAERARQVPVLFERTSAKNSGIEDDLLGLFTGLEFAYEGAEPAPPQIILFLENIWDEAGYDERAFRNEVRITYLHELGHYLGLDEDDLERLGIA